MSSSALLARRIVPSGPTQCRPTVAFSKKSASSCSLARSSASARRCSVTSRKISTTPSILPAASRIGAALSSMGRSVPSLATRTVWFARPTMTPSRSTFSTGFSTGWRVRSLTMGNTASSGCPSASACAQPVSPWATPLRNVTRPWASVAMTASPMLASVTRSHSRCSCSRSSARFRSTPTAISSATDAIASRVASDSGLRANIAMTPTSRSSTTSGYPAKATMPSRSRPLLVARHGGRRRRRWSGAASAPGRSGRSCTCRPEPGCAGRPGACTARRWPAVRGRRPGRRASRCGRTPRPGVRPAPRRTAGASPQGRPPGPAPPRPPHSAASSRTRSSSAASLRFRSLMSRKTSTLPTTLPPASRIGAAESSIGRSVPSLAIRTVWFASPTITPSLQRRRAGFSTGWRVSSLTMRNTSGRRPAGGFLGLPADELLGDRVEEVDPALGVGADDGIADARQRDVQPLPLLPLSFLGSLGPPPCGSHRPPE